RCCSSAKTPACRSSTGSRSRQRSRWCRSSSRRGSSQPSGRRKPASKVLSSRRSNMNKTLRVLVPVVIVCAAALAGTVKPRAATDSAREIIAEAQHRSASVSERYEGLLQSFDAQDKTSEKRWTIERLGSSGDSKSVIRFLSPAEVKGVALLIVNHPDRASDQWMWTPAIERDRRIALQDRSTRFFGTDFSFED